ncbi:MAG: acetyltransferase, partial [Cytophagaceae bacterium]|nr:acetyltransferase [Cytophagaceae bacterium]
MLLYGGSGHAKVIRDCARASGTDVLFIFDDNPALTKLDDTPVIGPYNPQFDTHEEIIIAIGDNLLRKMLSEKIKHKFGKVIHPSVIVSSYSVIEEGTVVMQGSILNAGCAIGKHCIINTASIVEHDCMLENFIHVSPNVTVCGGVKIGEGTHIGAGAVVTKNVPPGSLVMGVPGKVVRQLSATEITELIEHAEKYYQLAL